MDDIIQTYYFLIKNIFHAWHVHFFLFLLLIVIFMHLHISAYQEKRPEFENNRYCFVLLFFIVSCLLRTKMINTANFNITDYFFPMRFDFSALEENVLTEQMWFLPLISYWQVVTCTLIFCSYCFCPLMQEHFLSPLLKSKALQCG